MKPIINWGWKVALELAKGQAKKPAGPARYLGLTLQEAPLNEIEGERPGRTRRMLLVDDRPNKNYTPAGLRKLRAVKGVGRPPRKAPS